MKAARNNRTSDYEKTETNNQTMIQKKLTAFIKFLCYLPAWIYWRGQFIFYFLRRGANLRDKSIELFMKAHEKSPYAQNKWWKELMLIQQTCKHMKWVYSPDKEKRICGNCCLKQRSRTFGKDGYFNSIWIAPPMEVDRYYPRVVFNKWGA